MKADVLIINSPLFRFKNPLYDEDSLPPIGLGYIATVLKNKGHSVELIDAVAENIPVADLINRVNQHKPSFVALNVFTTNYELVREIVENISEFTSFLIGGLSTKGLYSEICNWKTTNPISVVIGDGEFIVPDIISNSIKEPAIYESHNKRAYRVDTKSIYFPSDISNIPLDRTFFKSEPINHVFGFTEANIITSRGCIYNCAFCAAARSINKEFAVREKSIESVISELNYIRSIYPGLDSIRVLDDLFLKSKYSIIKAISIFENFSFQWRSMAHVMTFKSVELGLIQDLRASGCSELFIGIESGSPKILKQIHKTNDISLVIETMTNLFKAGINVKGYFIYGFPEETELDCEMTYNLAGKLKEISITYGVSFRTSVFQFRPYHGTELYHDIKSKTENQELGLEKGFQHNRTLSTLIGRLQFNFHCGNYSAVSLEKIHEYIYKTTALNDCSIFNFEVSDPLRLAYSAHESIVLK